MSQTFVVQKLKGEGGRVGGKVRDLGSTKKCQEYKHHTRANTYDSFFIIELIIWSQYFKLYNQSHIWKLVFLFM